MLQGHYSDPNCRFTAPNQGKLVYQFDMVVGQCGVAFIDSGLTSGGQAYVEGMLVIILEPGVQEAWDASRRIRCLWEGNIDQTVTFPLSINMLDSQTLTFSGDTASASLEIQVGNHSILCMSLILILFRMCFFYKASFSEFHSKFKCDVIMDRRWFN